MFLVWFLTMMVGFLHPWLQRLPLCLRSQFWRWTGALGWSLDFILLCWALFLRKIGIIDQGQDWGSNSTGSEFFFGKKNTLCFLLMFLKGRSFTESWESGHFLFQSRWLFGERSADAMAGGSRSRKPDVRLRNLCWSCGKSATRRTICRLSAFFFPGCITCTRFEKDETTLFVQNMQVEGGSNTFCYPQNLRFASQPWEVSESNRAIETVLEGALQARCHVFLLCVFLGC